MIPAVSATLPAGKVQQTNAAPTSAAGQNTPQGSASRLAGETGAANLRPETARAVDPARQAAVAPRLRDQETAERTDRRSLPDTGPTGPAPAFAETFLQRAARLAFSPPEAPIEIEAPEPPTAQPQPQTEEGSEPLKVGNAKVAEAESGFALARTVTEGAKQGDVDIRE